MQDLENSAGQLSGRYDMLSISKPDFGKPGKALSRKLRESMMLLCQRERVCSATVSGFLGLQQFVFDCYTCALSNVCSVCIACCHAGHDVAADGTFKEAVVCVCGTRSHEGCARRLTFLWLAANEVDALFAYVLQREVPLAKLPAPEFVVEPVCRQFQERHDKWFTACVRLRQVDCESFKIRLIDAAAPPRKKGSNDEKPPCFNVDPGSKLARINIESLRVGTFRVVLYKTRCSNMNMPRTNFTMDFGTIEVCTESQPRLLLLPPDSHVRRLMEHAAVQFARSAQLQDASLTLRSTGLCVGDVVPLTFALDLSRAPKKTAETLLKPRVVVSRADPYPFDRAVDAVALDAQQDIPKSAWRGVAVVTLNVSVASLALDKMLDSFRDPGDAVVPRVRFEAHLSGHFKNDSVQQLTYTCFKGLDVTDALYGAFAAASDGNSPATGGMDPELAALLKSLESPAAAAPEGQAAPLADATAIAPPPPPSPPPTREGASKSAAVERPPNTPAGIPSPPPPPPPPPRSVPLSVVPHVDPASPAADPVRAARLRAFGARLRAHRAAEMTSAGVDASVFAPGAGPRSARPANPLVGEQWFDADALLPTWWNGVTWIDAFGRDVK